MSDSNESLEVKVLLGKRIAGLRKGAKWSQAKLAEKLEVSDNFVGQIERGERGPSITTLESLAQAFNVRVKDLFDFPDLEKRLDGRDREIEDLVMLLRTRSDEEISYICGMIRSLCKKFKDTK